MSRVSDEICLVLSCLYFISWKKCLEKKNRKKKHCTQNSTVLLFWFDFFIECVMQELTAQLLLLAISTHAHSSGIFQASQRPARCQRACDGKGQRDTRSFEKVPGRPGVRGDAMEGRGGRQGAGTMAVLCHSVRSETKVCQRHTEKMLPWSSHDYFDLFFEPPSIHTHQKQGNTNPNPPDIRSSEIAVEQSSPHCAPAPAQAGVCSRLALNGHASRGLGRVIKKIIRAGRKKCKGLLPLSARPPGPPLCHSSAPAPPTGSTCREELARRTPLLSQGGQNFLSAAICEWEQRLLTLLICGGDGGDDDDPVSTVYRRNGSRSPNTIHVYYCGLWFGALPVPCTRILLTDSVRYCSRCTRDYVYKFLAISFAKASDRRDKNSVKLFQTIEMRVTKNRWLNWRFPTQILTESDTTLTEMDTSFCIISIQWYIICLPKIADSEIWYTSVLLILVLLYYSIISDW